MRLPTAAPYQLAYLIFQQELSISSTYSSTNSRSLIGALTSHFNSFADLNHKQVSIVLQESNYFYPILDLTHHIFVP